MRMGFRVSIFETDSLFIAINLIVTKFLIKLSSAEKDGNKLDFKRSQNGCIKIHQ